MNFDFLGFLWYLIQTLAFVTLALLLIAICVSIINGITEFVSKKRRNKQLEQLVIKALNINEEQAKEIEKIINKDKNN